MSKKPTSKDTIVVRIDLKGEDLNHFLSLKEKFAKGNNTSVQNIKNTSVIRDAIRKSNQIYDTQNIQVKNEMYNKISQLLKSPTFQRHFSIESVPQFISRSIHEFIGVIESNRKSLRDDLYEILTELTPLCREIAMVLVELDSTSDKITLETLKNHLNQPEKIIIAGLEILIADGFIESMDFKGQKIYWII